MIREHKTIVDAVRVRDADGAALASTGTFLKDESAFYPDDCLECAAVCLQLA